MVQCADQAVIEWAEGICFLCLLVCDKIGYVVCMSVLMLCDLQRVKLHANLSDKTCKCNTFAYLQ